MMSTCLPIWLKSSEKKFLHSLWKPSYNVMTSQTHEDIEVIFIVEEKDIWIVFLFHNCDKLEI